MKELLLPKRLPLEPLKPTSHLMSKKLKSRDRSDQRGKLGIGNDWNAHGLILSPAPSRPNSIADKGSYW
jgi:hypothetical protein